MEIMVCNLLRSTLLHRLFMHFSPSHMCNTYICMYTYRLEIRCTVQSNVHIFTYLKHICSRHIHIYTYDIYTRLGLWCAVHSNALSYVNYSP